MIDTRVVPGDTVLVWPGDYGVRFLMKSGVVLRSAQGPEFTRILGAGGADPAITFIACSPSTAVEGFTFIWDGGPSSFGGAIGVFVSEGTIRDNFIRDSTAGIGSGLYLQSSTVTVENNLFFSNDTQSGAGVVAISGGAPVLRGNTFFGSTIPFGLQGADIYAVGTDFTLDRNILANSRGGPAIFCDGSNNPVVTCNMFWDNEFGAFAGSCVDSTGASGNQSADPLFCDPSTLEFGFCLDSPALSGPCGVVGYVAPTGNCPACASTPVGASLVGTSWGRVKARYR